MFGHFTPHTVTIAKHAEKTKTDQSLQTSDTVVDTVSRGTSDDYKDMIHEILDVHVSSTNPPTVIVKRRRSLPTMKIK